ncbi:hypothetical protein M5689_001870 [Euphorbia peplus]|nr:hypothetical protein M5689_001870 [Euphorbia peplus]
MTSLSSVGLGLSIVFGCLLIALIAELYYLFWWKRRFSKREIGNHGYKSPARELFYMFCLKKPSLRHSQELCSSVRITDALVSQDSDSHFSSTKDLVLLDPVDTELMRLNSLSGPPRFLFTIVEETKEDLESEDGKSRSLSDLILNVETPYLTPFASPPFFTPPLTPMDSNYTLKRFNHLFESEADAEFNKIRSSPPPKFKFLQDAEEKLYRKKLMEEGKKVVKDEEDGSFITIIVDKDREIKYQNHHQFLQSHSSSSSQVLPLASSPSRFTSADKKSCHIFH